MEDRIEQIWTDLHQELEKFIFSKVKDIEITKDILQDVFVKIITNLKSLKDEAKLTSWVYQIVRNSIIDFHRTKSKKIETLYISENNDTEPMYQQLSDCINKKINLLPEKYKQAIILTTFEDFSQIELSQKLNLSYSTIKSRIQRGKETLKNQLIECENNNLTEPRK
ncbi:ECF RNA polymerase sigma factor SigW [Elizabethkingia miricola]|nr:ECF RNA polymerase sigma factor SigW [Elizabethkingia miricola]